MKKWQSILLGVCVVLAMASSALTAAVVRNPQIVQKKNTPPMGYVSAPLRDIPVGRFLTPPTVHAISPIIAAVSGQQAPQNITGYAGSIDQDGDGTPEISCDGTNCDVDYNDDGTYDIRMSGATHARLTSNTSGGDIELSPKAATDDVTFLSGNEFLLKDWTANVLMRIGESGTNGFDITETGGTVIQTVNSSIGNKLGWGTVAHLTFSSTGANMTGSSGTTVFTQALVADMTNTRNSGTIALSGGTGTATTFTGAVCVCTDTTANNSVQCSVSGTTLTATGTTTDTIAYACF